MNGYITFSFALVSGILSQNLVASKEVSLATHPMLILTRAHNAAFGNKQNILTQHLEQQDKQEWLSMIKATREYINSIHIGYFSIQKNKLETCKKILETSLTQLIILNDELLNVLAVSFGHIARALPREKKLSGTKDLTDINQQLIDQELLKKVIQPLIDKKQVAINIQETIKNMPQTSHKGIMQGALIIRTLGLMLETTIDAVEKSLFVLEHSLTPSSEPTE